MKILSGKYKGRNLLGYNLLGTRPTMNRVKESLFAMIQDYIVEADVLDLFAGSGALGLEALSEGAKRAVFVDKSEQAIRTIKENIRSLGVEEEVLVLKKDYQTALEEMNSSFQIIFLDPPYQSDCLALALEKIKTKKLLDKNGILVLESDKKSKLLYDEQYYQKIKERKYGEKYIYILKKK